MNEQAFQNALESFLSTIAAGNGITAEGMHMSTEADIEAQLRLVASTYIEHGMSIQGC